MNNVNLLDCTLRDGGYVNNWHFGNQSIKNIVKKLFVSNVDYIECGYLTDKINTTIEDTQFNSIESVKKILPDSTSVGNYAIMINYGDYQIDKIPVADEFSPIIRVCFHKTHADKALLYCERLIKYGYRVFVQPMASLSYSDIEFIELINRVNEINPQCFYIVDSFGVMEDNDFNRLILVADNNLKSSILLGYHSHNNLQQAYENAKMFVSKNLKHDIVIDASVYGMGRGAGNLNMELFASYLNNNYGKKYNTDAFLDIMDNYLKPVFNDHFWGYSLPYYLSAQYNCHPNYASYFADKNTLSNKSMKQLLSSLPIEVKSSYSIEKAEKFYLDFQRRYVDDNAVLQKLKLVLEQRNVLLLAPGKSILTKNDSIKAFIKENNPVIISINVNLNDFDCDYVFCANEKRIQNLTLDNDCKLILTSNIEQDKYEELKVNYASYLVDNKLIADNPTIMLINILMEIGKEKVYIAGFDGYSPISSENYFSDQLSMGTSITTKMQKNVLIKSEILEMRKNIDIVFVTPSLYE